MSDRMGELRSRLPAKQQTFGGREDASMRWLELSIAVAAIAVVVLLAILR